MSFSIRLYLCLSLHDGSPSKWQNKSHIGLSYYFMKMIMKSSPPPIFDILHSLFVFGINHFGQVMWQLWYCLKTGSNQPYCSLQSTYSDSSDLSDISQYRRAFENMIVIIVIVADIFYYHYKIRERPSLSLGRQPTPSNPVSNQSPLSRPQLTSLSNHHLFSSTNTIHLWTLTWSKIKFPQSKCNGYFSLSL